MTSDALGTPRRTFPIALTCGVLLLILAAGYLYLAWSGSPARLYAQARSLRKANPQQALAKVKSSIRAAKGDFPDAQILQCQLLLDLHRSQEAGRAFQTLSRPERGDPESLCQLAEQAHAAGDLALAGKAFIAAGDRVLQNPQRLKRMIFVLYTQQEPEYEDRVLTLCQAYAQQAADDAFPWLVSASLYHERNVPNLAIEAYLAALERNPPPEEASRVRFQLVQLAMLLGDLRIAHDNCEALQKSSLDQPSQANLIILRADLLQREGRPEDAIALLNTLPAAITGDAKVRALRGKCLYAIKDYPGTIAELTDAIRQDDYDQASHYILGQAYLLEKNEELATQHLNRSRELNSLTARIFEVENLLRNDLQNSDLKRQLAELNEQRGHREAAAAWRRGIDAASRPKEQ